MLAWSPLDPWHMLVFGVTALSLFGRRLPQIGGGVGGATGSRHRRRGVDAKQSQPTKPRKSPPPRGNRE